jgi:hypothetical protein
MRRTGSTRLWLALVSYPPTTQLPAFIAFPPDCAIISKNENLAQRVVGHQQYTNRSGVFMQKYEVRGLDALPDFCLISRTDKERGPSSGCVEEEH